MDAQTHDSLVGYIAELRQSLTTDVARKLLPIKDSSASLYQPWRDAERAARDDRELCTEAAALVAALGFCRLFGIRLPDDLQDRFKSPLPPELLAPASIAASELATASPRSL